MLAGSRRFNPMYGRTEAHLKDCVVEATRRSDQFSQVSSKRFTDQRRCSVDAALAEQGNKQHNLVLVVGKTTSHDVIQGSRQMCGGIGLDGYVTNFILDESQGRHDALLRVGDCIEFRDLISELARIWDVRLEKWQRPLRNLSPTTELADLQLPPGNVIIGHVVRQLQPGDIRAFIKQLRDSFLGRNNRLNGIVSRAED